MIILRIFRSLEPISSVLCPKLHFQRLSSGTNQSSSLLHSRTPESIHVRNFSVTRTSYSNDTGSTHTKKDPKNILNQPSNQRRKAAFLLGGIIIIGALDLFTNESERSKHVKNLNKELPAIEWDDSLKDYLQEKRNVESIVFFPKQRVADVYLKGSKEKISPKKTTAESKFLEKMLLTVYPTYFTEAVKPDLRFKYNKTSIELKEEIKKFDKLADVPGEDGIYVVSDGFPSLGDMASLGAISGSAIIIVTSFLG